MSLTSGAILLSFKLQDNGKYTAVFEKDGAAIGEPPVTLTDLELEDEVLIEENEHQTVVEAFFVIKK